MAKQIKVMRHVWLVTHGDCESMNLHMVCATREGAVAAAEILVRDLNSLLSEYAAPGDSRRIALRASTSKKAVWADGGSGCRNWVAVERWECKGK